MLKVAYHQEYVHPLPENHRFPMVKYELLMKQLLWEGTIDETAIFTPDFIDKSLVLSAHDKQYVDDFFSLKLSKKEQRKTGFVHNEQLIVREQLIMEATRACAELAGVHGVAMNISGGTHHAFSNRGEGFCMLNDQAIAAQWLLNTKKANKILIIDLDVHQGNGTANILRNNSNIFTFSMHGENNYPLKKEQSDLDIGLKDGLTDSDYLYQLEKGLDIVLGNFHPDFIFFQSGVDIINTDKLGRLAVSIEGCKKRDEIVFNTVKKLNVPVVVSMGGGYSKDIKQIIEAHANTFRTAQYIFF